MNVNRWIRWSVPIACLLAAGLASEKAQASPMLSQPGLVQSIAPTVAGHWGFGRRGWGYGGWGGYRGWGGFGSYYYGRPSIYFGAYRPYYRTTSFYSPRYVGGYGYGLGGWGYASRGYGFASPYYTNYGYSNFGYNTLGFGGGYSAYRPVVYSSPLYTTSYYASTPAVYGYSSYYSGYGAYPVYSSYGYNTYSPYGASCGCW
jgi:hypothetical protein